MEIGDEDYMHELATQGALGNKSVDMKMYTENVSMKKDIEALEEKIATHRGEYKAVRENYDGLAEDYSDLKESVQLIADNMPEPIKEKWHKHPITIAIVTTALACILHFVTKL